MLKFSDLFSDYLIFHFYSANTHKLFKNQYLPKTLAKHSYFRPTSHNMVFVTFCSKLPMEDGKQIALDL